MRFMIIVKATAATEAGILPSEDVLAAMMAYNEQLTRAGALLAASGLRPSADGWRIRYANGERCVIDGPFTDTRDLIAGYTLIQVRSREEAMEWARRFPAPHGEGVETEIEIRPLYEHEDVVRGITAARESSSEGARR
jgi:hypothetical protein